MNRAANRFHELGSWRQRLLRVDSLQEGALRFGVGHNSKCTSTQAVQNAPDLVNLPSSFLPFLRQARIEIISR